MVLDARRDDLMVGKDRGNIVFVTGANDFVVFLGGELENLQPGEVDMLEQQCAQQSIEKRIR